jgi:hypothetical protein
MFSGWFFKLSETVRADVLEIFRKQPSSACRCRLVSRHNGVHQSAIAYPQKKLRMKGSNQLAKTYVRHVERSRFKIHQRPIRSERRHAFSIFWLICLSNSGEILLLPIFPFWEWLVKSHFQQRPEKCASVEGWLLVSRHIHHSLCHVEDMGQ